MRSVIYILFYFVLWEGNVECSVAREEYGDVRLFQSADTYDVETTVMLNEISRKDKEVAYKVKATLTVDPYWKLDAQEYLLKFELNSPHLLSRGKHVNEDFMPHKSIWESYPNSVFYAHWRNGVIENAYLDTNELSDVLNYKRALISLFQFGMFDGESTETDISGNCTVIYETLSINTIRKIKKRCWDEQSGWDEVGKSRRVTRYTLDEALGRVDEAHCEEVHEARAGGGSARGGVGVKVRVWIRAVLARWRAASPSAGALPAALATLPAALATLPATHRAAPLVADHTEQTTAWPQDEKLNIADALSAGQALWGSGEPGAGGSLHAARAALRVLPALCDSPADQLARALANLTRTDLWGAVGALGSCGTSRAHAAVSALLELPTPAAAAAPLLAHYLAALALAPQPDESVVADVWRLARDTDVPELADAALLCVARLVAVTPGGGLARTMREHVLSALHACEDDECRVTRLRALGNMARGDARDALLDAAERGSARVAVQALEALDGLPSAALLDPASLLRLERLALVGRSLETRAAALDLLLRLSADAPFGLTDVIAAVEERDEPELQRLLWQRLEALADTHTESARLVAMLPTGGRRWWGAGSGGTSSVLVRDAGGAGAAAGWRARLDSVQVASGGVLRRGVVRLLTHAPDGHIDDTISVELQTSGLESFTGGESEDESEDGGMRGVLALSVGGARLPALTLFDGQGELLSHVWAGTGSTPTAVARAVRRAGPTAAATLRLADGSALQYRHAGVALLALDAHATISLWSRNARAALELRTAVTARVEAMVRGSGGPLAAAADLELEPQLRIAIDLDFYDGVAVCVRARTHAAGSRANLTLASTLGRDGRRVRRARRYEWAGVGRTLSLGGLNDRACRTLVSADD